MDIDVHPLTNNPTEAWSELSQHQKVIKINAKPPAADAPTNKLRVVCMSDTHSLTPFIKFDIPRGDIFIHAGDFTKCGSLQEVIDFNTWIGNLPHKHKIVIAGNHELSFDSTFTHPFTPKNVGDRHKHTGTSILDGIPTLGMSKDTLAEAIQTKNIKNYLTNCTYLEDSEVTLYGIKIYGTPWQPEFCKWAFNVPRGGPCLSKWDLIPSDTDILITHTPPIGHGDLCCSGVRAGCVELLTSVQKRIKPKYHVFGHIHEGYGISSDGKIIYINASTCDLNYLPSNPPIVFDITLPPGVEKTSD
ncbi:metallophosphoesterase domain-containing protein 1 [Microplitis demolitor]|uniref:metallophosphoesterase domain-containing protein 1 n=1 Tax=Microplitis demolitor TaxID=69319 RepID=UPI0004CC9BEF|nr:metallophosphoesterase domain-containing protein 1 [Microplitis demolitor]XP_008549754.1 metallophosphoesterase domain-containing protein 1 [Microplitis demolitor]XP_008549755.1 metallophosphoesterase domain-containing protein 1 [Microplitis demolitor]XP_053595891.1 metallophosphoesterase domain-containing protein 1 [Microplitis demolitor]